MAAIVTTRRSTDEGRRNASAAREKAHQRSNTDSIRAGDTGRPRAVGTAGTARGSTKHEGRMTQQDAWNETHIEYTEQALSSHDDRGHQESNMATHDARQTKEHERERKERAATGARAGTDERRVGARHRTRGRQREDRMTAARRMEGRIQRAPRPTSPEGTRIREEDASGSAEAIERHREATGQEETRNKTTRDVRRARRRDGRRSPARTQHEKNVATDSGFTEARYGGGYGPEEAPDAEPRAGPANRAEQSAGS